VVAASCLPGRPHPLLVLVLHDLQQQMSMQVDVQPYTQPVRQATPQSPQRSQQSLQSQSVQQPSHMAISVLV
jgi:hypothetical protein